MTNQAQPIPHDDFQALKKAWEIVYIGEETEGQKCWPIRSRGNCATGRVECRTHTGHQRHMKKAWTNSVAFSGNPTDYTLRTAGCRDSVSNQQRSTPSRWCRKTARQSIAVTVMGDQDARHPTKKSTVKRPASQCYVRTLAIACVIAEDTEKNARSIG